KLGVYNEVTCLDSPTSKYLGRDSFKINAIGPSKGPWNYSATLIPWLLENSYRFDSIIIHGLWQYHSYAVNKVVRLLQKKSSDKNNPKLYVMPHGMLDPWFQQAKGRKLKAIRNWLYWKLIEGDVINEADGILFTCEEELKLARIPFQPYHPKNEFNVGYGILPPPEYNDDMYNALKEKCPEAADHPYILFLSRIDVKKGVDLLIRSYRKLKAERENLPKLIIAGPGMDGVYGKKMKELAANDENIIFPGMLSGDAKWGAFYRCEAFILPSHQENFGIAVVEALACRKPVLISSQVNIWNEINNGDAGLVEDDTLEGAYRLLNGWLNLPASRRVDISNFAKAVYLKHFSTTEAAKQLIKTINTEYAFPKSTDSYELPRS
ncbi:MAG TPA: glycosyltransferase, partial [Dyadobacter sp.]|nr:glycosyltransferase [Dyadobacter sp.]